jgi:hypothetical protein
MLILEIAPANLTLVRGSKILAGIPEWLPQGPCGVAVFPGSI